MCLQDSTGYSQTAESWISNKTGEPIPTANTDLEKYPLAAFKEAMELTNGFPYKKQKGVMLQAAFRSNYAIIGIPLAMSLGGDSAKAAASIVAAATLPLFNI